VGQREALANAFILYALVAIGLILAVFAENAWAAPLGFAWFTVALYLAGLALFLVAKFSLLRRGNPLLLRLVADVSFEPSRLTCGVHPHGSRVLRHVRALHGSWRKLVLVGRMPNKALQLTANSAFQLRFGSLLASTSGASATSAALLSAAERPVR